MSSGSSIYYSHLFLRQLSIEKSELEMTVADSNKSVERMSQNVEELKWRINNHYELPANVIVESSKPCRVIIKNKYSVRA